MSICKRNIELLEGYAVREHGLEAFDSEHARTCERCRNALREAESMRKLLWGYSEGVGELAQDYLRRRGHRELIVVQPRRKIYAWAGTAAAGLLIVLLVGILWRAAPAEWSPTSRAVVDAVGDASTRAGMMNYVQHSRNLLESLLYGTFACTEGTVEITAERKMARELAFQKKLLEPGLASPVYRDLRPLFDELEFLFDEVAQSQNCVNENEFEFWRQIIQSRATLTRLRLLQMEGRI